MKILYKYLMTAIFLLVVVSCDVADGENLNGADTGSISDDISRGELINAVSGIMADMRERLGTQIDAQSVVGREYWRVQSSDPRWVGDLLTGTLDDNSFYTTTPYAARYATVKNINLVLEGLANTTADFNDSEKSATQGFLNTIKAHEFLMVLNAQYQNGIRMDVSDPDNLGDFMGYDEVLTALSTMLSEAATDLNNGGSGFPFEVPIGFEDFNEPSTFLKFNKALNARIEAYRGNYTNVITLLNESFMDMEGSMDSGAYFTFSLTGADIANPLFFARNSTIANARLVHPEFLEDAEPDDDRVLKAQPRDEALTISTTTGNLVGTHDVFVYTSNVAPMGVIRNEELILLYAEANYESNPAEAVNAINVVRNAAGLGDYSGGTTPSELIDEILHERRYSLFAEGGHRWIDLRRFDKLEELPLDRSGDGIVTQFPVPANENIN